MLIIVPGGIHLEINTNHLFITLLRKLDIDNLLLSICNPKIIAAKLT